MNNVAKVNEEIHECLDLLDDLIRYAQGVKNLSTNHGEIIRWREIVSQCSMLYDNLIEIEAA